MRSILHFLSSEVLRINSASQHISPDFSVSDTRKITIARYMKRKGKVRIRKTGKLTLEYFRVPDTFLLLRVRVSSVSIIIFSVKKSTSCHRMGNTYELTLVILFVHKKVQVRRVKIVLGKSHILLLVEKKV